MSVIKAERLTKRFGKKVLAVDDVSFAIEAGTITGVLGPNGAGKTTTLRMMAGLIYPSSGSVHVDGERMAPGTAGRLRSRIGFLTEIDRGEWRPAIEPLLTGDFWLEPHMMLNATLWRGEALLGEWDVLNECVIGRGGMVRLVRLKAEIEGRYATHFAADALIVATPTGSTAYALAAGGPILPPDLRNILVVPVAPHLSVDRAIVLHEGSWVRVTVYSDHPASISADGQTPVEVLQGDRVDVRAGQHNATFVRFQDPGYFYRNLTSRLMQRSTPRVDE